MGEFNAHSPAHMEMLLEEVCNRLPYGGDHQTRKYVAKRLIDAARSGKTCRDDLLQIALRAMFEVAGAPGFLTLIQCDSASTRAVQSDLAGVLEHLETDHARSTG